MVPIINGITINIILLYINDVIVIHLGINPNRGGSPPSLSKINIIIIIFILFMFKKEGFE